MIAKALGAVGITAARVSKLRGKNCAKSPKITTPCVHRFAELRCVECPTCNGKVSVKVFGCEVHGECTIGKKLDGIKCCAACADYSPQPPPDQLDQPQE